jgi:hypothetical protein
MASRVAKGIAKARATATPRETEGAPSAHLAVPAERFAELVALLVVARRHCPPALQKQIARALAQGFGG